MISDYKLTSIEDTQNLRTQYLEEISPLKAQKEIYMKLYNKTDNVADKTILKARINILNEDIDRLNSKIQTCRRIICKAKKGEKGEKEDREEYYKLLATIDKDNKILSTKTETSNIDFAKWNRSIFRYAKNSSNLVLKKGINATFDVPKTVGNIVHASCIRSSRIFV